MAPDSPCSLLEVLRSEARVMEGLSSLHIQTPDIHNILKLNVQPSDSDYAVDIRSAAINVRTRARVPRHPACDGERHGREIEVEKDER